MRKQIRKTETKNQVQKNQKGANFRNALASGIIGFVLGLGLFGLGSMQQNNAAEAPLEVASVLGDTTERDLDTSAVAVEVIKEIEGESQVITRTNTVTNTVEVPGPTQIVEVPGATQIVKVPGETKIVKVPGPTQVVTEYVNIDHKYSLVDTKDNKNGTYDCTFKCGQCGDTYVVTIGTETELHEHSYNKEVERKEATCLSDGFIKYECECGSEKVEFLSALGHNWSSWTVISEATETTKAVEEHHCERCGISETRETGELVPVHEHSFEIVETIDATCCEDGKVVSRCSCGEESVEVLPALGHDYHEDADSYVAPTKDSEGKEADQVCDRCGDRIEGAKLDKLVEEHSHAYVETERVNATCCEDGKVVYTCNCGDSYSEKIPATGHNFVKDEATYVAPTEDSEGKEADEVCLNCGEVKEGAVISKLEKTHESHKGETMCTFNEYGYGFYNDIHTGEEVCTTRGAYRQYLADNYPECTICEDETSIWAE